MKIKKWNGSAWVQEYPEVEVDSIVATGTPSSSTYLRGDGTWSTVDTDTNTTYSISAVDSSNDAIIRLSGSDSTTDDIKLVAGSNITLTPSGDNITIAATDTNTTYTLGSFGITATAAELNKMDGVTATTTEINYVDGVTSAIQTQLNAKAPLASPALTGTPTAPTAANSTNNTQLATTAFVTNKLAGIGGGGLNFEGTISLSTSKTADDLYAAGLTAEGDYLIVSATGSIVSGGTLLSLAVQSPGDEGDSTLPVTLETGDWIVFVSNVSQVLTVAIINNTDTRFAPTTHNHSASQITSGTLGVARGGTGATSFTSGNVLIGAGTGAVTTLSRSGIDSRSTFPPSSHTHDDRYYTETEVNNLLAGKLSLTGGTMTGPITMSNSGDPIYLNRIGSRGTEIYIGAGESLGSITGGAEQVYIAGESGVSVHASSDNLSSGLNRSAQLIDTAGNASWGSGSITAGTFIGALSGNASTASKWASARTITLGGDLTGSVSLDGSANVTLSAQVTNGSHTHDDRYYTESEADGRFVNSTGDTMSGSLTVNNNGANGNGFISRYSSSVLNFQVENYASTTVLRSDTADLYFWQPSSGYQMRLNNNGAVYLNYDGSTKFNTTSGGILVSGNADVNGRVYASSGIDIESDQIYVDSQHGFVNSGSWTRNATPYGYIDIGPANSGHAHIYTDRPNFYFNKQLLVLGSQVYHTSYHPEADKWTTARTLSLTGDASGSTSWDGSGNASISVTVNNDSHNHNHSDGDFTVNGGLVVEGSINSGGYELASEYEAAGTNIILKGDGSGRSGIFFQSERDGTNINHTSDFGYIQFHPYGRDGTSGESNELLIGVSNDSDDHLIFNAPNANGLKFRVGASGTDYQVWHSGNDGSGSGLDADTVDGYHASSFALASHTHSYLPLSGGTITGNLITSGANINISQGNYITFYGGNTTFHSIVSKSNTGANADDLRINSYGAVYINLDSNINNSSSADFMIGRHGSDAGTIDELFRVSGETGLVTADGGFQNATSTVSGGVKARLSGSTLYLTTNGTNA